MRLLAFLASAWVVHVSVLVLLARCPFWGLVGRLLLSQLTQRGWVSIAVGMPVRCAATRHVVPQ